MSAARPPWNPFAWSRRATREVKVGSVGIGGSNPIRIQSMTTTDTLDTEATVAQVEALARAGCEIVRITAPGVREAENLGPIKAACLERGVLVPLVADIHFTPNAAMEAALHVEKVRINPGNYADKKRFEVREYSDLQYAEELERVGERFRPLVRRCKELGRAMRIGTNHGSLSDRIMNRFGDTALGMVESALEFLAVCEDEDYREVVFSMKASNPQVAIHAYRLLAMRLAARAEGEPTYPFHVGVTEAGDGEDGRTKSAIGIGALLEDGIGETVRVSLTEDPVKEVPVARALAARYDERKATPAPPDPGAPFTPDLVQHERRATTRLRAADDDLALGGGAPVRVEADLGPVPRRADEAAAELARELARLGDLACEGLAVRARDTDDVAAAKALREALEARGHALPLAIEAPALLLPRLAGIADRAVVSIADASALPPAGDASALPPAGGAFAHRPAAGAPEGLLVEWRVEGEPAQLGDLLEGAFAGGARPDLISFVGEPPTHTLRTGVAWLRAQGHDALPVVLRHRSDPFVDPEVARLRAATDLGAPLCDGIGDAVCLGGLGSLSQDVAFAYRVLQGARQRTSWTEFISCPSCGRTLFDLEETTARIKERTAHLPGVKIAVMGCIVNGPGEMADADFGYVGAKPGRVNLYVGHECVVHNVPEDDAPDRLVDLIREHGRWQEPADGT